MTTTNTEGTGNPARRATILGVRGRLLLAFLGIASFAVLAAGAGILAFREVGGRLETVDARLSPAVSALELSRPAERIIAAAPALLAAGDQSQRDEIRAGIDREAQHLEARLDALTREGTPSLPLGEIEQIVPAFTASLAEIDAVVGRRLETAEHIAALQREVFRTGEAARRLLAPWLQVLDAEIGARVGDPAGAMPGGGPEGTDRLQSLLRLQRPVHNAARRISGTVDMLAEASTTAQARRLPILEFQIGLAMRDLEEIADDLDPGLRSLFLQHVRKLRGYVEGPDSIPALRQREFALVKEGRNRLAIATGLSERLTASVDRLGSAAKQDIGESIRDALSVQRLGTRTLLLLVALSLLTSILIVWLYVGRNIAARLGALSDGMLAIAGGSLDTRVDVRGSDEIAQMGRAAEVFRRNAVDLQRLLEERREAAVRLERVVEERTGELRDALQRQTATARTLRVISGSPIDTGRVFESIVQDAVSLCGSLFANVFRFDGERLHFETSHNLGPGYVELLRRKYPMRPDRSQVSGRVILTRSVVRIEDALADPEYDQRFPLAAGTGWRRMLGVPMLREGKPLGVIVVGWAEPGPVAATQEELLKTFADQAVIAIENARLFREIQETSHRLEVANRYKSQFLAAASHDLRQPLHALNLFVAQLRASGDPIERERLAGRIDAAVSAMNELFEALLDMSKLEAGVLEADVSEFPVGDLFRRIETTFAESAREKGLRLSVMASSAFVRSDLVLLERILMNFVSNAMRYTAEGGVVVGARRRGARLRIDVVDTGPGIPEHEQKHVFDELYRSSSPQRGGGLGLGLAIVDRLGKLLGHPVELCSRPGAGSRFSVLVPRVGTPGDVSEPRSAPEVADPVRGRLVIVIDDDPLVIDGMSGILRSWGCEVLGADSEESALAAVISQPRQPDLLVADYRLAGRQSGIEAIKRIRQALAAQVPAFLISGDTSPDLLREAAASGYLLLHKPVPPMRLRAVLNQLLASRDRAPATR